MVPVAKTPPVNKVNVKEERANMWSADDTNVAFGLVECFKKEYDAQTDDDGEVNATFQDCFRTWFELDISYRW